MIDLDPNAFYYKFHDERIKSLMKFTICDCEIVSIDNGDCTVKACDTHIHLIKNTTITYISPYNEPAYPKVTTK